MPNFEITKNTMPGSITFSGEIFDTEIGSLKLNPVDRALLEGLAENPADFLLILEMLYRRHQEQTPALSQQTPTKVGESF